MVLKEVILTEREIEASLDQICDQLLAGGSSWQNDCSKRFLKRGGSVLPRE
jgi:hypothetical protein